MRKKKSEGFKYVCFGKMFFERGEFKKVIEYYKLYFFIIKELGDKEGE